MTSTPYTEQIEALEMELQAMDTAQLAALLRDHRDALKRYSHDWLETAKEAATQERKAAALKRLQTQVERIQERWLKHQQRLRTERMSILGEVQRLLESAAHHGIAVDIEPPARMDLSGVQEALEEALTPAPDIDMEGLDEAQLHLLIQEVRAAA